MPRITSLTMDSFRGRSKSVDLCNRNLILGENGSGKSSILLALTYVCTGRLPDAKLEELIAHHGDHRGFWIKAELDNGFSWTQGLKRTEEGKLKNTLGSNAN